MSTTKHQTTANLSCTPNPKSAASLVFNTTELLMMIFVNCLPEDEETKTFSRGPILKVDSHVQYDDLSVFLDVSNYWRAVALATPKLWARLDLLVDYSLELRDVLKILSFHLRHSRLEPISVRVSREYRDDPVIFQCIVSALFKHVRRWENISLDLPYGVKIPSNDPEGYDFPHLKTLHIGFDSDKEKSGVIPDGRMLRIHSAPNLRALAISRVLLDGVPPSVRSLGYSNTIMQVRVHNPCKLLTGLVLKDVQVSREDICRLPIAFPLLENLVLTSLKRRREPNVANSQTESMDIEEAPSECFLDNLTILKVEGEGYSWPLRLIIAPVLTKLTVIDSATETGSGMDHFDAEIIRFLIRSKAPIESFTYAIGRGFLNHRNLKVLLEHMPELGYLSMYNPKLCRADLVILHDPSVAPKLTSIHTFGELISNGHIVRVNDETDEVAFEDILELIQARCRQRGEGNRGFEEGSSEKKDRRWLSRLEFPLHKAYEKFLRRDPIFLKADVTFVNTHKCERIGNNCGRLIPGVMTRWGFPKFYEGKREW